MRTIFISAFLILFSGSSVFADITAEELMEDLNRRSEAIQDISATIEMRISAMGRQHQMSMKFMAKKPGKFKTVNMAYGDQIMASDGKYMYLSINGEVIKEEVDPNNNIAPMQSNPLLNWEEIVADYNYEITKEEGL